MIVALAGGVGGAKLAHGLSCLLPADDLTIVVNTGDDEDFYGLHVSPDIDTVMYTLADLASPGQGWGIRDDSYHALEMLEHLGADTWFKLGDRDLAIHLRRTELLRSGWTLSKVTAELCRRLGITHSVIPMSDQPVRTIARTEKGDLFFQDYFVQRRCEPVLLGTHFDGLEQAQLSTGFDDALTRARALVICPSNPLVSIGPILAIDSVRERARCLKVPRLAVSPIIAGEAVKGPAAKMLRELGLSASCVSVARTYQDLCDIFVIDERDAAHAPEIASLGMRPVVTRTLMESPMDRVVLASRVLSELDG